MDFLKEPRFEFIVVLMIGLIIVGAILLSTLVRWLITKTFKAASQRINLDRTRYKFFKNAASMIIWLIAIASIISLIPRLKSLAITLFAGAGILVAIVGFAAQQAFSNIISGVFIVIFKPFRVGDKIKVGNQDYGIVEDITLRHTIIRNYQNLRIIIPNSVISSEVIINDTIEDEVICRWIDVGISYDSDVDLAIKIIRDVAIAHPDCIDHRTEEQKEKGAHQVEVRLVSFGEYSINLRAFVWTTEVVFAARVHADINKGIKKQFDALGIEIPFPYRTVVYKKDLPPNAKGSEHV